MSEPAGSLSGSGGPGSDPARGTGRAGRRSRLGRILLRAGNPLDWSAVDRTLLATVAILPFTVWYWVIEFIVLRRPAVAPYFNRAFLPVALVIQSVFVVGWLALALVALAIRRRAPSNRVLPFVALQFYSIGFGVASYYQGHYTSPFGGVVCLSAAFAGTLLFERWIAIAGIASFLFTVGSTTVAEMMGVVPYAPLFDSIPIVSGHLDRFFVMMYGVVVFGILLVAFVISYYIVDRWRDRDAKLAEASEQLARANELISRYVASQLATQIRSGNYDAVDRHERRKLTLFFSDIKDFAATADEMEPEDLSALLNDYLCEMTDIAKRYGATIDKFVGDAIMIFFGAPVATGDRDHALRAVRMAADMQLRMLALREKWLREGIERPFAIRIGINTGHASIGNFGSTDRMDYTAIGRQVNLAARLQAACEPGKILLSHSTWVLVQDDVDCEAKGQIEVKGFRNPVQVYEVVHARVPDAAAAAGTRS